MIGLPSKIPELLSIISDIFYDIKLLNRFNYVLKDCLNYQKII